MSEKLNESLPAEGYQTYTALIDSYARLSPQHQGLGAVEFHDALTNPAVSKTEVEVGGEIVAVPQLSPIEHSEWLNTDFYKKKFPDEMAGDNLLYFVDLPEVVPGSQVQSRLRELASKGGVLVFDYPDTDAEYPTRVHSLLESLGIEAPEPEIIGNQTYFAGQTKLIRKEYPLGPLKSLDEAFAQMIEKGEYDTSQLENGASLQTIIAPEDAQHMLCFYEEAYEVLNDHPCRQGLSPEEFLHMMTENEQVIKVVNKVEGKIVALLLIDNNLDELSWVNSTYYKEEYSDKTRTGQAVCIPGLAADTNSNVSGNTQEMINLIAELGEKANNDMLVVFDCCDMNTGFLDKFIDYMINQTPQASIAINPIAVQRYCAIKTSVKQ